MNYQTVIISVLAAVVVLALLWWRSKRDERRAREADERFRRPTDDVLVKDLHEGRVEPDLHAGADDLPDEDEAPASEASMTPSEDPTIYRELEREEAERRKAAEEQAGAKGAEAAADKSDRSVPPVDPAIEWALDISPRAGQQFSLGGVGSLVHQVRALNLPLLVRIWAQSSHDGLYYEAEELAGPARHIVAALVLANRSAKLDEVMASRFYQVFEQSAAQNEVAVRRSCEPQQAAQISDNLKRFVEYYDTKIELRIAPTDPEAVFAMEAVDAAAKSAGFRACEGAWEFRPDPTERDPVMTLRFADDTKRLILAYDIPLGNLARGDLKRFFANANFLACVLHAVWLDAAENAVDAFGALAIEDAVRHRADLMEKNGVRAGSSRARLLFSRSA